MSKRTSGLYIGDIFQALKKIKSYTRGLNFEKFGADPKTVDAVVRNLEIVGEAVRNLSTEVKDKYPQVPWEKMIGMRNKVAHEYFGVDTEILWQTIKEDLPELEKQLMPILKSIK